MNKKLFLLIFCCILFVTACTPSKNNSQVNGENKREETEELTLQLKESEEKVAALTKELQQLEDKMKAQEEGMEYFPIIANLTREFIQAHTAGDKEKLAEMLSDELELIEKEDGLYILVDNFEWPIYYKDSIKLDDWVIQGYDYDRENNAMNIFTREFLIEANGEPVAPPTFLQLTFKKFDDTWKITSLAFDV